MVFGQFGYVCDSTIGLVGVVKRRNSIAEFYSVFFLCPRSRLFTFKPLFTYRFFFLLYIFSCMLSKSGPGRPAIAAPAASLATRLRSTVKKVSKAQLS